MKTSFFTLFFKRHQSAKRFFGAETRKHALIRFLLLFLVLGLYYIYVSHKLGTKDGILVTVLTWTFFIFCTPIADAGFVLAFPVRLITGVRMLYTQIFAYFLAFAIDLLVLIRYSYVYNKTLLLKLFRQILTTPWPYWIIILLSFIGTFASIYFGDELMDVSHHEDRVKYHRHINKYKILVFIFLIVFTILLYDFLLRQMNIKIPLI